LGERSEDTRRRVKKADLLRLSGGGEAEKVLNALTDARLVTSGEGARSNSSQTGGEVEESKEMVEVSHEALLRDWPRLRAWLEDSRDSLRYGRRLAEKAEEWNSSSRKRHPDRLLRGATLEEALQWAKGQKTAAPGIVQEFLRAAVEDIIFVDQETGLMWTRRDNGEDINWHQANEYARDLTLGGYTDWRLPSIEELEKLHDPKEVGKFKIRKPFRVTGYYIWSSTREDFADIAWSFFFLLGKRSPNSMDRWEISRALCVRRSGE